MLTDEALARIERRLSVYIATDHPAGTWASWYRQDVAALRAEVARIEGLARGRYPSGTTKYEHYPMVPSR